LVEQPGKIDKRIEEFTGVTQLKCPHFFINSVPVVREKKPQPGLYERAYGFRVVTALLCELTVRENTVVEEFLFQKTDQIKKSELAMDTLLLGKLTGYEEGIKYIDLRDGQIAGGMKETMKAKVASEMELEDSVARKRILDVDDPEEVGNAAVSRGGKFFRTQKDTLRVTTSKEAPICKITKGKVSLSLSTIKDIMSFLSRVLGSWYHRRACIHCGEEGGDMRCELADVQRPQRRLGCILRETRHLRQRNHQAEQNYSANQERISGEVRGRGEV